VNFQFENVLPAGADTVQVVITPRATDEGEQLSFTTLPGELPPPPVYAGQLPYGLHWGAQTGAEVLLALSVRVPALTPVTIPVFTVATPVLLLDQLLELV
jgi:hypothetical protein